MEHNTTIERQKPNTKHLWRVFWILLVLTALEFVVAFQIDADTHKWLKISIFVVMTIIKAYYIVGIFMHLWSESKSLIWSMGLPLIGLAWLILALLIEGEYFGIEKFF